MNFNNTAQHLNETCKRVVFPLPLRPNIKPKLQKIPEFQKKIEDIRKKNLTQGSYLFSRREKLISFNKFCSVPGGRWETFVTLKEV
jgi:hypothetical protein